MVQLTRIYTRGGDKGKTSLGTGARVPKNDVRVAAYGTVDETNAAIGLVRLHTACTDDDDVLERIQNDLFDLGADLCTPDGGPNEGRALRISAAQVERLEQEIDAMNATLESLKSFVLPGGCAAASYLHMARTIARRAERLIVDLANQEPVNPYALAYANRLSDHLFVMARALNAQRESDILWTPGANR